MSKALTLSNSDPAGVALLAKLDLVSLGLDPLDLEEAQIYPLAGDASARRYWRVHLKACKWLYQKETAILMAVPLDHPEEALAPFLAVGSHLERLGLSVPHVYQANLSRGIALLEDLGDGLFGLVLDQGLDPQKLYQAAIDVLVHVHDQACPDVLPLDRQQQHAPAEHDYQVPVFTPDRLQAEVGRFLEWYVPLVRQQPIQADEQAYFFQAWQPLLQEMLDAPLVLTQFDYHSPNLLWLPERCGMARVGVLDFQDAVRGLAAYDVVSLAQDARRDVDTALEATLKHRYCMGRCLDSGVFERHYAIAGAQRATRILGTFARLAKRDCKPRYLLHQPRMWRYLERNLSHPDLAALKLWFDRFVPPEQRWLDWERFAQ